MRGLVDQSGRAAGAEFPLVQSTNYPVVEISTHLSVSAFCPFPETANRRQAGSRIGTCVLSLHN